MKKDCPKDQRQKNPTAAFLHVSPYEHYDDDYLADSDLK